MFEKYYKSILYLGLLVIAAALEDQSTSNQTVSSTDESLVIRPLFTKIGTKYYFIETEVRKNWYDAYITCRQMGAHLVAFDTADEWAAVVNYLNNNNLNNNDYWTSGTDLEKEANHIWFPTANPILVDIWILGEPNNQGGIEHCDHLRNTYALKLNDAECELLMQFICELPKQVN